jgi:hypothetical protein
MSSYYSACVGTSDKIAGCHISYVTPGEASLSSNESLAKIGSMVKATKRHEHIKRHTTSKQIIFW